VGHALEVKYNSVKVGFDMECFIISVTPSFTFSNQSKCHGKDFWSQILHTIIRCAALLSPWSVLKIAKRVFA
jgi:hypothetical protein